jgi:hypothetical protein
MKNKSTHLLKLVCMLMMVFNSFYLMGQETYTETIAFEHTSATTSRPKFYNKEVFPKTNYYAIAVAYSNNGQPTCGWCYPNDRNQGTPRINNYGGSVTLSTKCDGGPCGFSYTITYKKYYIDETIVKVTKDVEENLSSNIWVENKGNSPINLVYKVETYDPGSASYKTILNSILIQGYTKARVMPRYVRVGTTLREDFFTPLYVR